MIKSENTNSNVQLWSAANMYRSRKSYKLDERRKFCKWVDILPYSELMTHTEVKTEV